MLKSLDPLLSPDLLHALASMGHGDEIVVADAHFPGTTMARRLIRMDGVDATRVIRAIASVMPLDTFVEAPAAGMQVVGDPKAIPEAVADFGRALDQTEGRKVMIEMIERHAFYERSRNAFAVVQTGELRTYANLILKKGVVGLR
ncbi:MAG: ribose ABC transporter [Alphaproteobacteria bacterium]|nr:ribose ABC transporter [Alphaproteobacteria bacterium]